MRTRQERVATDTRRSPGCRTTPLEHWSKRKPTVEPRWAKHLNRQKSSGPNHHLDTEVVRAETVERFKEALTRCYWTTPLSLSVWCINVVTSPTPYTAEAEAFKRTKLSRGFYRMKMGAYKYRKTPKYRKATKIPESTYKYQKAMRNIGKMML